MAEEDSVQTSERITGSDPLGGDTSGPGARPRRLRGWYRAVERGEPWAVKWWAKGPFGRWLEWHIPPDLFREELMKRDFLLKEITKDDTWTGATLIVPFKTGGE